MPRSNLPKLRRDAKTDPYMAKKLEEELDKRAEKKAEKEACLTGANPEQKKMALAMALNATGRKKYSWIHNDVPETPAQFLGKSRAKDLGITEGSIAKELKIGKYAKPKVKGGHGKPSDSDDSDDSDDEDPFSDTCQVKKDAKQDAKKARKAKAKAKDKDKDKDKDKTKTAEPDEPYSATSAQQHPTTGPEPLDITTCDVDPLYWWEVRKFGYINQDVLVHGLHKQGGHPYKDIEWALAEDEFDRRTWCTAIYIHETPIPERLFRSDNVQSSHTAAFARRRFEGAVQNQGVVQNSGDDGKTQSFYRKVTIEDVEDDDCADDCTTQGAYNKVAVQSIKQAVLEWGHVDMTKKENREAFYQSIREVTLSPKTQARLYGNVARKVTIEDVEDDDCADDCTTQGAYNKVAVQCIKQAVLEWGHVDMTKKENRDAFYQSIREVTLSPKTQVRLYGKVVSKVTDKTIIVLSDDEDDKPITRGIKRDATPTPLPHAQARLRRKAVGKGKVEEVVVISDDDDDEPSEVVLPSIEREATLSPKAQARLYGRDVGRDVRQRKGSAQNAIVISDDDDDDAVTVVTKEPTFSAFTSRFGSVSYTPSPTPKK